MGDTGTGSTGQTKIANAISAKCTKDGCDFILEDESGRALVHARSKQTKVLITKDANTWVGPLDRIDRELDAFLRWHGRVQHHLLGLPQRLREHDPGGCRFTHP